MKILQTVARKENLTLPDPLAERIAKYADRNMRKALLCLETMKTHNYPFADNQVRCTSLKVPNASSLYSAGALSSLVTTFETHR